MGLAMRYAHHLKGNLLVGYHYDWFSTGGAAADFYRILTNQDYESLTQVTETTDLSITEDAYATTTHEYIMDTILATSLILSGVGRGNLKVTAFAGISATSNYGTNVTTIYAVVTILARDAAGTDRTLGTVTTGSVSATVTKLEGVGGTSTTVAADIPFSITFNELRLNAYERVIMKIDYKAQWTQTIDTAYGDGQQSATANHALNTDNIFIELPIAGN